MGASLVIFHGIAVGKNTFEIYAGFVIERLLYMYISGSIRFDKQRVLVRNCQDDRKEG